MAPNLYQQAQLAARDRVFALDEQAAREIAQALEAHARELSGIVRRMSGRPGVQALRLQQSLFDQAARDLNVRLQNLTATNRAISYSDVLTTWRGAANKLASARNIPLRLLGAVNNPPVSLLGVYENVGAGSWRTLVGKNVRAASDEANRIVRQAFIEGANPRELARRLRPYISGAENFKGAFTGLTGSAGRIDLDGLSSGALRGAARRLEFNTRRIAWSEIHNARAEAEVQHFASDPLIAAVRWTLAPDRGAQAKPDECDVFATSDLWGLGEGLFPVDQVPLPPHPFDRCERVPVTVDELDMEVGEKQTSAMLTRKDARSFGRGTKGLPKNEAKFARDRAEAGLANPVNNAAESRVTKILSSVGDVAPGTSAKEFARSLIRANVPKDEAILLIKRQFPNVKNASVQYRRALKQVLEGGGVASPPAPPAPVPKPKVTKTPKTPKTPKPTVSDTGLGTRGQGVVVDTVEDLEDDIRKKIQTTHLSEAADNAEISAARTFISDEIFVDNQRDLEAVLSRIGVRGGFGKPSKLKLTPARWEVINVHLRGMAEMRAKGYRVPRSFLLAQRKGDTAWAWYTPQSDSITINMSVQTGKSLADLQFRQARAVADRFLFADSAFSTMSHEMAHLLHQRTMKGGLTLFNVANEKQVATKMAQILNGKDFIGVPLERVAARKFITSHVSEYATQDGAEFVAEVFAKLSTGGKMPDEIMELYRFYQGPPWIGSAVKNLTINTLGSIK